MGRSPRTRPAGAHAERNVWIAFHNHANDFASSAAWCSTTCSSRRPIRRSSACSSTPATRHGGTRPAGLHEAASGRDTGRSTSRMSRASVRRTTRSSAPARSTSRDSSRASSGSTRSICSSSRRRIPARHSTACGGITSTSRSWTSRAEVIEVVEVIEVTATSTTATSMTLDILDVLDRPGERGNSCKARVTTRSSWDRGISGGWAAEGARRREGCASCLLERGTQRRAHQGLRQRDERSRGNTRIAAAARRT